MNVVGRTFNFGRCIAVAMLSLVALFLGLSGTANAGQFMPPPGDADCDGSPTSVDAALVLQYDAGLLEIVPCSLSADLNKDTELNALDAALILQLVAGLIDHVDTPTQSGVRGLVTIGPQCPVKQKGVPCPDLPFSATIVVEDESATEVESVTSSEDGLFEVKLDPGSYVLIPQSPNDAGPPFASPQPVDVLSGEFTDVLIQYDSGIR